MRWTEDDLAAWVGSKTSPLRNGVFRTAACVEPRETLYRKCVNGIWFQPRDTVDEAAACEQVAVDAPAYWRGLVRNLSPLVLQLVTCTDRDCPACVARREDGLKMLAAFEATNALVDSLRAPAC